MAAEDDRLPEDELISQITYATMPIGSKYPTHMTPQHPSIRSYGHYSNCPYSDPTNLSRTP